MSRLEPGKEEIRQLLKLPKDQPVTMLNLLKFKKTTVESKTGREMYQDYMEAIAPLLKKIKARPVFLGDTKINLAGMGDWDMVALIKYPSPRAFLEMVSSKEYTEIAHLRKDALEDTLLLANLKISNL